MTCHCFLQQIRRDLTSSTKFGPWELAKHSESTVPKIVHYVNMRLDRFHLLILILFLPDRNAFASIN